jgi:hypothetical protein
LGREALVTWREVWADLRGFVDALVEPGGANG